MFTILSDGIFKQNCKNKIYRKERERKVRLKESKGSCGLIPPFPHSIKNNASGMFLPPFFVAVPTKETGFPAPNS